jgi:hypothetical protein
LELPGVSWLIGPPIACTTFGHFATSSRMRLFFVTTQVVITVIPLVDYSTPPASQAKNSP